MRLLWKKSTHIKFARHVTKIRQTASYVHKMMKTVFVQWENGSVITMIIFWRAISPRHFESNCNIWHWAKDKIISEIIWYVLCIVASPHTYPKILTTGEIVLNISSKYFRRLSDWIWAEQFLKGLFCKAFCLFQIGVQPVFLEIC